MNSDVDTIALGAAAILDANQAPYWAILSDWLMWVVARTENGEDTDDLDVCRDFAAAFTRVLMAQGDDEL